MPAAAPDDAHHQRLLNRGGEAMNNELDSCSNMPLQTLDTKDSTPSSTAAAASNDNVVESTEQSTKAARRQSLRSYLQNVSLSDSIAQNRDAKNSNSGGGKTPKITNGGNRRRRLEVMGLLQHLKINRYGNNSSSSTLENNLMVDDNTKGNEGADADTNDMCGKNNGSGHSQERCLLHPTVRMRNGRCSLCNALAKTLEVRKAKLNEGQRVLELKGNSTTSLDRGDDNVGIGNKDGVCLIVGDNHTNDKRDDRGGSGAIDYDAINDSKLLEDQTNDEITTVTARFEEGKSSVADVVDVISGDVAGHQDLGMNHDEQPQIGTDRVEKNKTSMEEKVSPSKSVVKGGSEDDELDLESVNTALKCCRLLDDSNDKCSSPPSSSSLVKAVVAPTMENRDENDEQDADAPLNVTSAPLTKLQKTIALAKGAIGSAPRRQKQANQRHPGQVESNNKHVQDEGSPVSFGGDEVATRHSASNGSNESESQSSSCDEVPVSSTASPSDVSLKSSSDLSTLTSSTMGNGSLGSNSLGLNSCKTYLPNQDDSNVDDGLVKDMKQTSDVPPAKQDCVDNSSLVVDYDETTCGPKCNVKTGTSANSGGVIVEDVFSDSDDDEEEGENDPTSTVQEIQQSKVSNALKSDEEECHDRDRIESENVSAASLFTPKRENNWKGKRFPSQSFSPTSVIRGPSEVKNIDLDAVNSNVPSCNDGVKTDQKSLRPTVNSFTPTTKAEAEASPSNKVQHQYSEVEKRLSRTNQRLSRSIRRDASNRRRSRSRSAESQIPFFAALVENARSRSNSRTRRRSRSRSATRKGEGDARMGGNSDQRSRSRSVQRKSTCEVSNNGEGITLGARRSRSSSRSRFVTRKGDENERNKDSLRSRSTASNRKEDKNITTEGKNLGESNVRKGINATKDGHCSIEKVASNEGGCVGNDDSLPNEEASTLNQSSPEPVKSLHRPDLHSMTVKALKTELDVYNLDYSSFCEKEQFISAAKQSRESCTVPQPEITSMTLSELRTELTIFDVDYSSFKEKSEFVVALKKSRKPESEKDSEPIENEVLVTPIEEQEEEEGGEVNLKATHREPITHPRYELGDVAKEDDMIIFPKSSRSRSGRRRRRRDQDSSETSSIEEERDRRNQIKVFASVKELRHLDAAFIRRSDGSWTYALVADGDSKGVRFVLDKKGSTKTLTRELWKKNVRRVKVLTQRKGDVLKVNEKPLKKKRDIRCSILKRKKRTGSPSPTRNYRVKLDALTLPPTIVEEEVFLGSGIAPKLGLQMDLSKAQVEANIVLPTSTWAQLWE